MREETLAKFRDYFGRMDIANDAQLGNLSRDNQWKGNQTKGLLLRRSIVL